MGINEQYSMDSLCLNSRAIDIEAIVDLALWFIYWRRNLKIRYYVTNSPCDGDPEMISHWVYGSSFVVII